MKWESNSKEVNVKIQALLNYGDSLLEMGVECDYNKLWDIREIIHILIAPEINKMAIHYFSGVYYDEGWKMDTGINGVLKTYDLK